MNASFEREEHKRIDLRCKNISHLLKRTMALYNYLTAPKSRSNSNVTIFNRKRHGNDSNLTIKILLLLLIAIIILYFCSMYNVLFTSQISLASNNKERVMSENLRRKNTKSMIVVGNKKQNNNKSILKLSTKHGEIKIKLRSDLSHGSVQYLYKLVESDHCDKCNFYRAENPGILQGILENRNIPVNDVFGSCPHHAKDLKNDCPPHDKG